MINVSMIYQVLTCKSNDNPLYNNVQLYTDGK